MAVGEGSGAVEEMEREAGIAPPARRIREEPRKPRITSGGVLRLLVFVALAAFLLYYVGPRDMSQTSLKVALAVVFTGALWVGANLLFDQAYDHWTRFNTIIGAALGFVGYFVADSNGSLRTIVDKPVRPSGTGLIDGDHRMVHAAVRRQLAAVGPDRRRRPRVGDVPAQRPAPAARPPPAGRGRLHRVRAPHRLRPRRLGLAGARLGQAPGLHRRRRGGVRVGRPLAPGARPRHRSRSSPASPSAGWSARGAAPTSALATSVRSSWPPSCPRRSSASASGSPPSRTPGSDGASISAPGPGSSSRRRWRFITVGLVGPLVRTIYLSFHNRNGEKSVGWDNYHTIFTSKNFINTTNWQNIFTSRLFYLALALLALGIIIGVLAGRRTSQPFERGPSSVGPILAGAVRPVVRGLRLHPRHDHEQHLVGHRRHVAGDGPRTGRRRARRPGEGREHGQVA